MQEHIIPTATFLKKFYYEIELPTKEELSKLEKSGWGGVTMSSWEKGCIPWNKEKKCNYLLNNQHAKNMTYNHKEESKRKISEYRQGKKWSDDIKEKISINRKGKAIGQNNAMAKVENRKKVSQSKIGRKALYKDGKKKLVLPNSDNWNKLITEGYRPK